jgi:dihydroneopterin aldolase
MTSTHSSMLITICFEKLRFFAFHGLYEEEKKSGNEFEMDIKISFSPEKNMITDIDETINYATVFELIREEMQHPRELLETFLAELAEKFKLQYPAINNVEMKLYKLTAPISEMKGRVGVQLFRQWSA